MALGLLAGLPVLVLILATLGALSPEVVEGLPVVPWQTLWSLPLDRWLRDVAAAIVLGCLIVGGLLAPRLDGRLLRAASIGALVWLVVLLCQVPLAVSELLGRPLSDSLDPEIVRALVTQTELGRLLVAQIVFVALVALLGWAALGRVTASIVLGLALTAAVLPALSGHSGLHGGHTAASVSLAVHLVAVGVWVGGLIAVTGYALRSPDSGALVIRRFSTLALVCVIVLAESGLLNASLRVDGVASLITTPYGTLIVAKATLLAALVVLGWRQRRYVVPRVGEPVGRAALARVAGYEVVLMGVALGVSVALSRTAPPAGAIAGDHITAGALAILGLALPLVLVWAGATPARLVRLTSAYPEPFAVLLVVITFVAATVVPSGLLGIDLAAMIASLVLVFSGWAFAIAATGARGVPAALLVLVLWPATLAWAQATEPSETAWQTGAAALLGIGCVAALLLLRHRGMTAQAPAVEQSVIDQSVVDQSGTARVCT